MPRAKLQQFAAMLAGLSVVGSTAERSWLWTSTRRMIVGLGVAEAGHGHRQMTRRDPCALGERCDIANMKSDNLAARGDDRPRREDVGLDGGALGGLGGNSK